VVALRLGDWGDPVDQLNPGHEPFELDGPRQAQVTVRLLGAPARDLFQEPVDLLTWE
jgi:hypothetical protein